MIARPHHTTRPTDNRPFRTRRGMTLVELLVTITIIALLSSMVLMGISGAQEQAREKRTQAQIAKLHELIMEKLRSFETRRVPVSRSIELRMQRTNSVAAARRYRLSAMRELIRMELPDRISDVVDDPAVLVVQVGNATNPIRTSLNISYNAQRSPTADEASQSGTGARVWSPQYQGAECLYMIVANIRVGDSTALKYFNENEIGDTDNDGMPEILDGWKRPINFVRWAPGFQSPMQTRDPGTAPDPLDPMGVDDRDTFALVPLIFSHGPDGDSNIRTVFNATSSVGYANTNAIGENQTVYGNSYDWVNDPYTYVADGNDEDTNPDQMGQLIDPQDDGHIDNIYNHFLEAS